MNNTIKDVHLQQVQARHVMKMEPLVKFLLPPVLKQISITGTKFAVSPTF